MATLDQTGVPERLQFFNGQRLFAADLQGLETFNREMRWLHNRSLHQPGIGSGFAVSGKRGDREITIGPGYAVDALGREIVATSPVRLQVPPVAHGEDGKPILYDLVVSYPDDSLLKEAENREGVCAFRGVVRLREEPVFCWIKLTPYGNPAGDVSEQLKRDILTGMRIVIARVEISNCQLSKNPSIAERRVVRQRKQPYVMCGTVSPVAWEPMETTDKATGTLFFTAPIDTKAADFSTTPCYFARINGPRDMILGQRRVSLLALDLLFILDPRSDRFTVVVFVIVLPPRTPSLEAPSGLLTGVPVPRGGRRSRREAAFGTAAGLTEIEAALLAWIKTNWGVVWFGVEG